jgi:hypothetical protein
MRCYECGGEYVSRTGALSLIDKYIGLFTVDPLEYMKCEDCGDLLFSPAASKCIESARKAALEGVLQSQPISAFISASETASFLGISRQALHKHRRIRRGFIFHTSFAGNIVYLKKSVDLFAKSGDGRFVLCQPTTSVHYTKKAETASPGSLYSIISPVHLSTVPSFGPSHRTRLSRRYNYA